MFTEIKNQITGVVSSDCINLLKSNSKEIVLKHTISVEKKAKELGVRFGADIIKLSSAAYLHDISVIIPRYKYADICNKHKVKVNGLEKELPILLHQKISSLIASEVFQIKDSEILSAISCHTTLKANPSDIDMILFLSDKLKWDQHGIPPYKKDIKNALSISLESACYAYINYILQNNMIIKPHPELINAYNFLKMYI